MKALIFLITIFSFSGQVMAQKEKEMSTVSIIKANIDLSKTNLINLKNKLEKNQCGNLATSHECFRELTQLYQRLQNYTIDLNSSSVGAPIYKSLLSDYQQAKKLLDKISTVNDYNSVNTLINLINVKIDQLNWYHI